MVSVCLIVIQNQLPIDMTQTLGIFCIIWLVAQVGLGAGSVWFDGAVFGGGIRAKAVWKYHR